VAQVFDSLTAIDPETGGAVPAAASSWRVDAGGRVWRFSIRRAAYHDGRPVTAGDFKFAFDRIARKRTRSDAAFQLEHVAGFRAAKVTGTASGLAGVRALGDRSLEIRLDSPFMELPSYLAHPALGPVQERRYARNPRALATAPSGNGPFRVAAFGADRTARLARNDDYGGPTALLDAVELRVVDDVDEGWRAYLDGRVEAAEAPPSEFAGVRTGSTGSSPFWAALYYGFNLRLPKYAKPAVRRALSFAIDREAIARTVYGGTRDPAKGIIPRGVRGFAPDACGACALNRDRARSLLRDAFGGSPPPITVDHLDDPVSTKVAQAIAADLRELGVRASVRAHDSRAYLKLLRSGKQDLAELAWLSDVPSPDGFLAQQLRTTSPNNPLGFSDRLFDARIDRARAERSERKRLALYRAAEARALDLMPLVPIVFFRNRVAIRGLVRDLAVDGAGLFDAARVWLARAS
jgi:peptide/nickel transport system substrate-binding protein/oligopeptide transport system substrate-binding protein